MSSHYIITIYLLLDWLQGDFMVLKTEGKITTHIEVWLAYSCYDEGCEPKHLVTDFHMLPVYD